MCVEFDGIYHFLGPSDVCVYVYVCMCDDDDDFDG